MAAKPGFDFDQANRFCRVKTPVPEGTFAVRRLVAEEGISRLFRYDLELISSDVALTPADFLGQNVTVTLELAGGKRYFNGIVARFAREGTDDGLARYRLLLVPRLWLLARRIDSRIFENLDVLGVVREVLQHHNVDVQVKQKPNWVNEMETCVQYQESDLALVLRLLEREGLGFHFTHEADGHTLHIVSNSKQCARLPVQDKFLYLPRESGGGEDQIMSWHRAAEVRSGEWILGDYNYVDGRQPNTATEQSKGEYGDFSRLVAFEYPAEIPRRSPDDAELLAPLDDRVRLRMELEDARIETIAGASQARALQPGFQFTVDVHANAGDGHKVAGDYLLTSVVHVVTQDFATGSGATGPAYENTFTAIPAKISYRPERVTPRPRIPGPQTAFVVGDAGEEIAVDALGRLRVQFHWNRHGSETTGASCWARVAQAVAGNGWGMLIHPRVGQEVVVEFLEGDPDRPLVTGCVYNGTHALPYDKPTQTGLRTRTTPDGNVPNFNELRFDDKAGEENIFLHAEGDLDIQVRRIRREVVGGDRHLVVQGKRLEQVDGDQSALCKGTVRAAVEGFRYDEVTEDEERKVGGLLKLKVGGDVHHDLGGNLSQSVSRASSLDAGTEIVLDAGTSISLVCGGNSVVIDQTGVTVKGSIVTIDGNLVNINSGGGSSPGSKSAAEAAAPEAPEAAEVAQDRNDVSDLPA